LTAAPRAGTLAVRNRRADPLPRFSANLSMLFKELPLLDRIDAAADLGFKAIEFQAPYAEPAADIAARAQARGLEVVLINAPSGPRPDDRGLGGAVGREEDFWATFVQAMDYATAFGSRHLRVISGFASDAAERAAMEEVLIANLQRAAPVAAAAGVILTLEPINPVDGPGYVMPNPAAALAVIDKVGAPNLSLQFDFYHTQMSVGDLAGHARRLAGRYSHVQFSNAPGRHEPGVGEIHYPYLFDLLDEIAYPGWVGCEYWPSTGDTRASLAWAKPWGIG